MTGPGRSAVETAGLPKDWVRTLARRVSAADWERVLDAVAMERAEHDVFPPGQDLFAAFRLTPYDAVRVVLVGQDPYPAAGQAHGLCFSVPAGVGRPRSLVNIHRLLEADLGIAQPSDGRLVGWAEQGVLLLNTALTVRAGDPGSHARLWSAITDAVLAAVSERPGPPVVFVLWGAHARRKQPLIDPRHPVITAAHPVSYPSAKDPFLTSKTFSRIDAFLAAENLPAIDWTRTSA